MAGNWRMGILRIRHACVWVGLFAASTVAAETAYVTDVLRLRMFSDAELTTLSETLVSGDAFEVLSRNSRTVFIELPDGRQGYVSAAYIVTEKPAALIVNESQAEVERLSAELSALREAFAEPAAVADALRADVASLQAELDTTSSRAASLADDNADLRAKQEQYRFSLPYTWVGGALLLALIGGVLLGFWWVDRQSRRRHGGIRVY